MSPREQSCLNASWERVFAFARIEELLKTQNEAGSWIRVLRAVRRFDTFLVAPDHAKTFGMCYEPTDPNGATEKRPVMDNDIVKVVGGRARADLLSPGVDTPW